MLPPGRSPLHVCALTKGIEVDKIKVLLQIGVDKACVDLNGNTFFHIAAREDQSHILKEFMGRLKL